MTSKVPVLLLPVFLLLLSSICLAEVTVADVDKSTSETVAKRKQAVEGSVVKSGLQPGAKTYAFHVQDVTGPRAGKTLCYACAFGKHSVINIQTKNFDDELIALLRGLDPLVQSAGEIKGDSQHAFVVYLTEDPDQAEKELAAIAKKAELKNIPLTVYDDLAGPKPYKLSDDAEVTIMMWKNTKVTTNHAFPAGGIKKEDVKPLLVSASKHLKLSKSKNSKDPE